MHTPLSKKYLIAKKYKSSFDNARLPQTFNLYKMVSMKQSELRENEVCLYWVSLFQLQLMAPQSQMIVY